MFTNHLDQTLKTLTPLTTCLGDYRDLWRHWLPLLVLSMLTPLVATAIPLVERQLIDDVIGAGQLEKLPATIGVFAALWITQLAIQQVCNYLRGYLGERYLSRLRQGIFNQSSNLAVAFAHRQHSGRTLSLFTSDLPILANFVSSTLVLGVASVVCLLVAIYAMFSLSPPLAVAGGLAPLVVFGIGAVVTRPLRPAARRVQAKVAEVTERLQEHLAGIREISAFGREGLEQARFATSLDALVRLRSRVMLLDAGVQSGTAFFSMTVTIVLLGFGAYLIVQGQTTLGTVIAMRSLFALLFQPLGQIVSLVAGSQVAMASAERLNAFQSTPPQVTDMPHAHAPARVQGRVEFDNVSFAYATDRPVLQKLSFAASPGETIALVGASGAGKSTIASLMARFYDPTNGRVLLDGVDVRDLTLEGLRAQIGFVFQDTFLFAATVRDNIAFGLPDADDTQVIAAARAANAWEYIERLPKGLDTYVGERGVQLSEGQRQRIGIARALLRNPRILILDEPTSALDARSELLVQSALDRSTEGRTTFVIAHRLATVEHADRILVLDGGRVVEEGTHAELLAQGGVYRELFDLQFGRQRPGLIVPTLRARRTLEVAHA